MLPIVITASAFQANEQACLQSIIKIMEELPHVTSGILIDQTYTNRISCTDETIPISRFTLSECLDSYHAPLAVLIRTRANQLSAEQMILLDARHHEPQLISAVLQVVSATWFHLKNWQPAFVLIVDDFCSVRFVRELADTFYILPLSSTKEFIQAEVKSICLRAAFLRWVGSGRFARLIKAMLIFSKKLKHYVKRRLTA